MIRKKVNSIIGIIGKRLRAGSNKKQDLLKTIYENVVKGTILYGAEIWGEKANDSRVKKQLDAIQRPFLLGICRAYRTAPTSALQVLAGIVPINIEACIKNNTWKETENIRDRERVRCKDRPKPGKRRGKIYLEINNITQLENIIYTDGSWKAEECGMGIAFFKNGIWVNIGEGGGIRNSALETELVSIALGLELIENNFENNNCIYIINDCLIAIQMIGKLNSKEHLINKILKKIEYLGRLK